MDYYDSEFEPIAPKAPKPVMAVLTGPTRSCVGWAMVKTSKLLRLTRRYVILQSAKLTICIDDNPRSQILSIPLSDATLISTSARNECLFRTPNNRIWVHWTSEADFRACRAAFEFFSRLIDDYYKLVTHRQLGKGRSSEVVFAFDTSNGDHAAVKILNKDKVRSADREFAEKEVLIRASVQHPCVVQTLDIFESPFDLFIVMELMAGGSLDRKIAKMGHPLDEIDARIVMRRLFAALHHLHVRNIAHRNIKPQNIYLDVADDVHWPGTIKISDFSLACLLDDPDCRRRIVGTPEYLAPEASFMTPTIDGSREVVFGPEMDMWACGVTLYNLLSMQLPFEGDTPADVFKRSRRGRVRFGHAFASVSYEGMSLIRALLQVDRRKRLTAETALLHPWFLSQNGLNDGSSSESETLSNCDVHAAPDNSDGMFGMLELSDGIRRLRIAATAVLMLVRLCKQTPAVPDLAKRRVEKKFQFNVSGVNIVPMKSTEWDDYAPIQTYDHVWGGIEPKSIEVVLGKDGVGRTVSGTAMSRVSTGSTAKSRSSAGTDSACGAGFIQAATLPNNNPLDNHYQEGAHQQQRRKDIDGPNTEPIGQSQAAETENEADRGTIWGRWRTRERL